MPDSPAAHFVRPKAFNPRDVLEAMAFQSLVVALAASDLANGKTLGEAERIKLFEISGDLYEAIEYATGHRLNRKDHRYAVSRASQGSDGADIAKADRLQSLHDAGGEGPDCHF
jgi:hypothetical protein